MRRPLLGLLVAATGCSDFTLVEPDPAQPLTQPSMSVLVTANRSDISRYELSAFLVRGIDSRGQPIDPADPAVYVEGTALEPTVDTGSDLWRYDWAGTRTDGGAQVDSLRLRPPVLAGSPLPGLTVTIPIGARDGPADATWAQGDDLRLHVSSSTGATPQLSEETTDWMLELGDTCDAFSTSRPIFVLGRGAFPAELRIPWEWLRNSTPVPAAACLRVVSRYRVSNAPYRIDVFVELHLAWRIHVAGTS